MDVYPASSATQPNGYKYLADIHIIDKIAPVNYPTSPRQKFYSIFHSTVILTQLPILKNILSHFLAKKSLRSEFFSRQILPEPQILHRRKFF